MSVLLIYAAVSRFSFLGGGVTAPSDFSFLVSRFSFLVPRFSFLGGGVTGPLERLVFVPITLAHGSYDISLLIRYHGSAKLPAAC